MVGVMKDRHISVTVVAAAVLWVIGCGLMIAGTFDLRFMGWGLWASGIGGCLTVRWMMCHQHDTRNAFELGRDYERSNTGASVRSLR